MFEDIHTFQRGCATIQTSDHCYNNMVGCSVLYDRVLKTKMDFDITVFLNIEQGTSREGYSK